MRIALAIVVALMVFGVGQVDARYVAGYDVTYTDHVDVIAPAPRAEVLLQRPRPIAPARMQEEQHPGLDPVLPPGPTLPADVIQGERTRLLQRFVPRISRLDRPGEEEVVGRLSTFQFEDCQMGTADVQWTFVHMDQGLPAQLLSQQGRCRMQVRWRAAGLNRVHMSYATYGEGGRITQRLHASELPVEIQPASPGWRKPLLLSMVGGLVGAGIGKVVADRRPDEPGGGGRRLTQGAMSGIGAGIGALSGLTLSFVW